MNVVNEDGRGRFEHERGELLAPCGLIRHFGGALHGAPQSRIEGDLDGQRCPGPGDGRFDQMQRGGAVDQSADERKQRERHGVGALGTVGRLPHWIRRWDAGRRIHEREIAEHIVDEQTAGPPDLVTGGMLGDGREHEPVRSLVKRAGRCVIAGLGLELAVRSGTPGPRRSG